MIPKEIVIHHSATHDGPENNTAGIRKWHIGHNGWADIGYHCLAEYVGNGYEILLGRPWEGTCVLPGGKTCDVWEYYNGTCDAGS